LVAECSARYPADLHRHAPDLGADLDGGIAGDRSLRQRTKATLEGCPIAKSLLRGRIGRLILYLGVAKKRVGGRNDIFDLRAGLGLEQRNAVDKDGLIGKPGAGLLQAFEGCACLYAGFKNRLGLDLCCRR